MFLSFYCCCNHTSPKLPFCKLRQLSQCNNLLRNQVEGLKNEIQLLKTGTKSQLRIVNSSIQRLVPVATFRHGGRASGGSGAVSGGSGSGSASASNGANTEDPATASQEVAVPFVTSLSKSPRTLHVLWEEWEFGVGGRHPAKGFNSPDRGRVKSVYSFRKVFWDICGNLIKRGYSHSTAIDLIYQVYGTGTSVTKILKQMHCDKKLEEMLGFVHSFIASIM